MTILTIVGARPQFIKAWPVSLALERRRHRQVLVHTGQHYDDGLSAVFFRDLKGLPRPDHHFGSGPYQPAAQLDSMLSRLRSIVPDVRPDWVLVYGDTTSTLAGALAASFAGVPLAHVEAGMRCGRPAMAEERNRVVTDHLAQLLLCSNETAAENCARDWTPGRVRVVGDVMRDALELARAPNASHQPTWMPEDPYVFATLHRAENVDDPQRLQAIVAGLGACGTFVLWPMHPRTRDRLDRACWFLCAPGPVLTVSPVSYLDALAYLSRARCVVTDSGGLQKEAYWLGVPCLTIRDETEWPETVQAGWNQLVPADPVAIATAVRDVSRPADHPELYGPPGAADRVVDELERGR